MAQVILTAAGTALGGPLGGALGGLLGGLADRALVTSLQPARQVGPRLDGLRLQSTAEGAPMACAFGRVRVTGQVIWAARFKEHREESRSGGGKGGQKTVSYSYSLSFAVGLCEGPIDGLGRVWADGKPMDMTGVVMRLYNGGEDQTPDALIEAVEGEAPAFRGTAYVVFEDLPLDAYGDRPPQLSFEVFRRARGPGDFEDLVRGVCLIPGAGEFVYGTEAVLRRIGLTRTVAENVNNAQGDTDLKVSLDQLAAQFPNLETVMLVVAWFGDDLRAGRCRIRPGVEQAGKDTLPYAWRAGGVERADAHLVSAHDGGPAYGGTPADQAVREAIAEIKARGWRVGLYPFLMMDIPEDNALSDPYGGARQAAYPWRGRITGDGGSADAADEIAAFFGDAGPGDFALSEGELSYAGPDDWGFRRQILHCAHLAAQAGGVDTFLIGSELRGLTTLRDDLGRHPAVGRLRALAADCRAVLGEGTAISYSADWSEYFGHQPADGSGDVIFHLDPLWADDHIDFVGVDWYAPLTDWRDGESHLDALAGYRGPHDEAYLAACVAGGADFDWFYASDADRAAQVRTPITDGAYGEPWVFRAKDLAGWWGHAHHDRPGGVRATEPTDWIPQSKPIRMIEFGCPAVDKGANSPNLFVDPKSAESGLPPFSNGARDDLGQRVALQALLKRFDDDEANPTSEIYGRPMLDAGGSCAWCWDARPYPDFPARRTVWADAPNWSLGHWLNGRAGASSLAALVAALAARGGVEVDVSGLSGLVTGYLVDRPMPIADAIAPLAAAFAFDACERGGQAAFVMRDGGGVRALGEDDLVLADDRASPVAATRTLEPAPDVVRVRFIDETADYQTGSVACRRDPSYGGGSTDLDLPVVMDEGVATGAALRRLALADASRDTATAWIAPTATLAFEAGDLVALPEDAGPWRVERIDVDEAPRLSLSRVEAGLAPSVMLPDWRPAPPVRPAGPPVLHLLDLPPLPGAEEDARPLAAVAADPWRAFDVFAGERPASLIPRGRCATPATAGETLGPLAAGPLYRLDEGARLSVRVEGASLASRGLSEVLAGANAAAVRNADGGWEIVQFLDAQQTGPETWTISRLLRGQCGSEPEMAASLAAGAPFVLLDQNLVRVAMSQAELGLPLIWRAAPAGGPPSGAAMAEAAFTWRGLAWRPWSPAHLSLAADAGDLILTWVRRARLHGDGWESDPPLAEESERYRVEVLDGDAVLRTIETGTPAWTYLAADQAADFPAGTPNPLTVRVAQGSAVFGWGSACVRDLLY